MKKKTRTSKFRKVENVQLYAARDLGDNKIFTYNKEPYCQDGEYFVEDGRCRWMPPAEIKMLLPRVLMPGECAMLDVTIVTTIKDVNGDLVSV